MKQSNPLHQINRKGQSTTLSGRPDNYAVSIYRISLVKDGSVSFGKARLNNAQQAWSLIQSLIRTKGQPDREQFAVALLNTKNEMIGLNIVSVGSLSTAPIHPREVVKPAILANAAAMILCHNHPSNDVQPSTDDFAVTRNIIKAAKVIGIKVHDHIIINMEDARYYSFADQGIIKEMYAEVG